MKQAHIDGKYKSSEEEARVKSKDSSLARLGFFLKRDKMVRELFEA